MAFSHYSIDLTNLSQYDIKFELSKPFKPLQQLLAVLPSASSSCLPPAYRTLMTDLDSPLVSYYPLDFSLDMNDKKNDWEAIVLIPYALFYSKIISFISFSPNCIRFIDAELLKGCTDKLDSTLTEYEFFCNTLKLDASEYKYDKEHSHTCKSTMPSLFHDIIEVLFSLHYCIFFSSEKPDILLSCTHYFFLVSRVCKCIRSPSNS